jgi:hypothetical protein
MSFSKNNEEQKRIEKEMNLRIEAIKNELEDSYLRSLNDIITKNENLQKEINGLRKDKYNLCKINDELRKENNKKIRIYENSKRVLTENEKINLEKQEYEEKIKGLLQENEKLKNENTDIK